MIATQSTKMAVVSVLYLKRERLGLTYEEILVLADEITQYISNFQRIEAEVIEEVGLTLWNLGGCRALGQLSVQQLLDLMEDAQHAGVDQSFVDKLLKELRHKLTQDQS